MDIDIAKLISEVYRRPALWDQSHKNYRNRALVERQWKEIAKTMQIPRDCVKKKWKNIRDQFRNECKKIPFEQLGDCGIAGEELGTYTNWRPFTSLLFLRKQMKTRKPWLEPSLKPSPPRFPSDLSGDEASLDERLCDEMEELFEFDEVNIEQPARKARIDVYTETDSIKSIEHQNTRTSGSGKINRHKDRDYDEAFFDSLLPYMRKMDMNKKLLCRSEIQKIIYSYTVQDNENSSETP